MEGVSNSVGLVTKHEVGKKKPKIDKVFKQKGVIPKKVLKLFGEKDNDKRTNY